ncbi:hypothetical protein BAUCODRAFT_59752, partial [Baudoinia panamericana UAMH 10762]
KHFDCDVSQHHASEHFVSTVTRLHNLHKNSAIGSRAAKSKVTAARQGSTSYAPIASNIPLYIHVISSKAAAGAITQKMADDQAAQLNSVYKPHGISFAYTPSHTDFTVNDAWAVAAGADMAALKAALRKGTYSALNLYFHTDLNGGILGTCTLPSRVTKGVAPATYASDGCNINAFTMPNSSMLGYNMGMTAVHETGHWLGLLHTFEGYTCSGNGDFVSDTPFESVSTNGCPATPMKNSCPSVSTGDPIHNYMDYSTDACYSIFTPLQVARISSMWTQYRQG